MKNQVWEILDNGVLHRQILKDLKSSPQINLVELFVSDNCPLKCRHCFHADVRSVDTPLSLEEWKTVIEKFIQLGARHFHIAGREPFTERITLELLDYLSERKKTIDLKFGAISNGMNSRKHLLRIQQSKLDYLEISVDGLSDTHDYMRGKGTYRHTWETLGEALSLLGQNRISIATAIHKANISQIPDIIQNLSRIGVRKFFFQPVMPMGYALNMINLLIEGTEYRRAILELKEFFNRLKNQNDAIAVMFYVPPEMTHSLCEGDPWLEEELVKYILHGSSLTKFGRSYLQLDFNVVRVPFWRHFIVTEDGYIINECSSRSVPNYIDFSIGNVLQEPLSELIHNSRQFAINYVEQLLAANHELLLEPVMNFR
jgi:MoaA/NifB/PqqE/SkfB family radical SAM enzyme